MLTFHVKNAFYDMFKNGSKTHEFRFNSDYWKKRLSTVKKGDDVRIYRGYTNEYLNFKYVSHKLLKYDELKTYVKVFFGANVTGVFACYIDIELEK